MTGMCKLIIIIIIIPKREKESFMLVCTYTHVRSSPKYRSEFSIHFIHTFTIQVYWHKHNHQHIQSCQFQKLVVAFIYY